MSEWLSLFAKSMNQYIASILDFHSLSFLFKGKETEQEIGSSWDILLFDSEFQNYSGSNFTRTQLKGQFKQIKK